MLGHVILVYSDNGEVIFKQSEAINESAMGTSIIEPVSSLLKNNTRAQLIQKAKQSCYQEFKKGNYQNMYPLNDDLYVFVNLIQNKVDIFARYRPFFDGDDILDMPEPDTDPLNLIHSFPLQENGQAMPKKQNLEKALEQVLGEIEYLEWINEKDEENQKRELYYDQYGGTINFNTGAPANRLPKVFKEILKSRGYTVSKDNDYSDIYKAKKHVGERLEESVVNELLKKEKKALRIDTSEEELADYIQALPMEVKAGWSNKIFMRTGESLFTATKDGVYHYNGKNNGSKYEMVRESGYVFNGKDFDEIYKGVPLRDAVVLGKEYSYSPEKEREGIDLYFLLVNGYVRTMTEAVSPKRISLLIENIDLIDDPKLNRLVKKYKLMEQHINGHRYHY